MKELLERVVKELVDMPDQVKVVEVKTPSAHFFEINVAPLDRGKVIGRKGAIIGSLRTLVNSMGMKYQEKIGVNIVDEQKWEPRMDNTVRH